MPKPIPPGSLTEVVANPEHDRWLRRHFSAEDKRRILAEAEGCPERGQLAALLRRERLYSSQLATRRAQLQGEGEAGLQPKQPGRKPLKDAKARRIERLEAEKAKLERKLLIAEKLIELQKKHRSCWPRRSRQTNPERAGAQPRSGDPARPRLCGGGAATGDVVSTRSAQSSNSLGATSVQPAPAQRLRA